MTKNPIICALDTTDATQAGAVAASLHGAVGAVKLGLEFFTANGAFGVSKVGAISHLPVFLDLKFHDIPNTVARAIRATVDIDTFMITVHAAGGMTMLKAAADAAMEVADITGKAKPLIIGVTVLTSLDEEDLQTIGVESSMQEQVKKLADLAQMAGLDGVVCSPHEIALLRAHCGPEFQLVVPGIRPAGSGNHDQKRVLTPHDAIAQGADYLVIGRPITEAADPAAAAKAILGSL